MCIPEQVYFLEDLVKALKANSELQCVGIDSLKCPTEVKGSDMHPLNCDGIPEDCDNCLNQNCKQYLVIYRKNNLRPLRVLKFNFMARIGIGSGLQSSGFIPKNDTPLKQLIDGRYITLAEPPPDDHTRHTKPGR